MKNTLLKFISGLVFVIFNLSCSNNDLPIYTELNGLRILSLVASQPELDAGGSTVITPILSDINETTSLNYVAEACIPVSSFDSTCDGNATKVSLGSGALNTGDMTSAKFFTGAATNVNVTVPASGVIYLNRSSQDQFNGVVYLVTYKVTNSRSNSVSSFKRIIVSTRTPKNQNPQLSDVLNNGGAFTSSVPTSETTVAPSFGAVTTESYTVLNNRGESRTETESLTTTWFSTDGKFKYYRTVGNDSNTFTGPSAAPTGRDAFLLAITRDGRGGIAYKRKCFGTCP